jgi:hypothetical protein
LDNQILAYEVRIDGTPKRWAKRALYKLGMDWVIDHALVRMKLESKWLALGLTSGRGLRRRVQVFLFPA